MSSHDNNLKSLLSPSRCGTFFAPFRSRSANPDGFDSKMKLWINAIEEWVLINKKITISPQDVYNTFVSDSGIRPDKECIRLVFSEMKRRSKLVPKNTLKNSRLWTNSDSTIPPIIGNIVDTKSWLGWGVTKLVVNPASWALSSLTGSSDQAYSDLTDLSITDNMVFVSQKSLNQLSKILHTELVRISKAERQFCFEWHHLVELIAPIINTIVDATDSKELLEMLDLLMEYLAINKHIAIQIDDDNKLVKVANPDESRQDEVAITKKDIAMARLLRAKEALKNDADKYHEQAEQLKKEAVESYNKKDISKAKSLLRSHHRLTNNAEQKRAQIVNVEIMLDQLENTDSNKLILGAYKAGAEALKVANTKLDNNVSILDEVYDVNAEAEYLNSEMSQMLNDISQVTAGNHNISMSELEAELNELVAANEVAEPRLEPESEFDPQSIEQRLKNLRVCQDEPTKPDNVHTEKEIAEPSLAT